MSLSSWSALRCLAGHFGCTSRSACSDPLTFSVEIPGARVTSPPRMEAQIRVLNGISFVVTPLLASVIVVNSILRRSSFFTPAMRLFRV